MIRYPTFDPLPTGTAKPCWGLPKFSTLYHPGPRL